MGFSFFKNDDQLFNEAVDLVKRKEYDKAIASLRKAREKDKDGNITTKCTVMESVLFIHNRQNDPGVYQTAANNLRALGDSDFELGLTTFNSAKLATECEMMAKTVSTRSMDSHGVAGAKAKGDALIKCAQELQVNIGNDILMLNEFYNNVSISGAKFALTLMAEGNECYSAAYAWDDPKKAAEYQQFAYNYRRQLGETGDNNQALIKSYSRSASCWFCGRDTTGEGMHFFAMSSDISPQQRGTGDNILPSADESFQSIYVCRACYTAISRRSDAIAKHYHDISMTELRNAEARLQAEIASLEAQIASLRAISR